MRNVMPRTDHALCSPAKVAAALTLLALLAALSPAALADQCDLLIKWNMGGTFYSDNTYQTTPSSYQHSQIQLENGQIWTYEVRVQNDSASARTFLLKATGAGGSGWTVAYKYGETDISDDILGDGWTTPTINADEHITVTIEVTPDGTVSLNATKVTRIDAYLDECDESVDDSVQGTYTVADLIPDLLVRANTETVSAYAIDDTYQSTPSGAQIQTEYAHGTVGAWFRVLLQNDGTVSRKFLTKVTVGSGSGWTVLIKQGAYNKGYWLQTTGLYLEDGDVLSIWIVPDNTVSANSTKDVTVEVFGGPDDTTVRDVVRCTAVATGKKGYFASPTGSEEGDGSFNDPWDLETALAASETISPGDTLWLRGGTYGAGGGTTFTCLLNGTQANPITVRSYTNCWPSAPELATIDGGLEGESGDTSWVTFRDLEITNSETDRECAPTERRWGANFSGQGLSLVNSAVHDCGHPGIGFWKDCGDGARVEGCLIWGNGIYDTYTSPGSETVPWIRGSAVYTQNYSGTRYLNDNIVFRNFTCGLKPYTEAGYADGYNIEGNTSFDNMLTNIELGTISHPAQRAKITENCIWESQSESRSGYCVDIGVYTTENDVEITDNYIAAGTRLGFRIQNVADITLTGNTVLGLTRIIDYKQHASVVSEDWDNNTYASTTGYPFALMGAGYRTFTTWKSSTGFDTNSSFSSTMPTSNQIFVRNNAFEPGRSNVTVYNWAGDGSVSVTGASLGLEYGDTYEIRDGQNYYGSLVASGTYNGSNISIPMNQTTVAQPLGDTPSADNAQEHWSDFTDRFEASAPYFGVFVVSRTNTR